MPRQPIVVLRVNGKVSRSLRRRDARERLYSMGAEPTSSAPEAIAAFIHNEMAKWAKVAGIRVE